MEYESIKIYGIRHECSVWNNIKDADLSIEISIHKIVKIGARLDH